MNEETTTILIDTALASGSASALDAEERKLQELVLGVRDDAPVADPQFELRMNARVAAGFPPRKGRQRGRIRTLLSTRPQLAAMGAAASLLIALVVALSAIGGGGGDSTTSSNPGGGSSAAETAQAPAPNAAGGSTAGTEQAAPAEKATAPSGGIGSDALAS